MAPGKDPMPHCSTSEPNLTALTAGRGLLPAGAGGASSAVGVMSLGLEGVRGAVVGDTPVLESTMESLFVPRLPKENDSFEEP